MNVLWAPWRLRYVSTASSQPGCIFCDKPALRGAAERRDALILCSNPHASVMMNRFPYAHAHLLVAPRAHVADFARADREQACAVLDLVRLSVTVLEKVYHPGGFNIGMNLGRPAGAGIADHMHWHVVPRWEGDTNFMPMLADVRVMPEHLEEAFDKLLPVFEEEAR